MVRVAVLDDYQQVALSIADWSPLAGRAEVISFGDHLDDEAALVARLSDFDVVVAMRERTAFPAALLRRLPRLRLLVTTGMANAAIDLAAAAELGVLCCGTGGSGSATGELAWALLQSLARGIPAADAEVRDGQWQRGLGRELAGATLGLLGLGRLGSRMAHYAQAFDMHCIAWSQHLTPERAAEVGVRLVSKAELFGQADIVSVHLRLSERTAGLVGAAELALLGPDGLLVNTSRGPIVTETALIHALRTGVIAGAALDVFDLEPLPADHPIRSLPNTVLTPHIGYVSRESYEIYYTHAVEDIAGWLDGQPLRALGG